MHKFTTRISINDMRFESSNYHSTQSKYILGSVDRRTSYNNFQALNHCKQLKKPQHRQQVNDKLPPVGKVLNSQIKRHELILGCQYSAVPSNSWCASLVKKKNQHKKNIVMETQPINKKLYIKTLQMQKHAENSNCKQISIKNYRLLQTMEINKKNKQITQLPKELSSIKIKTQLKQLNKNKTLRLSLHLTNSKIQNKKQLHKQQHKQIQHQTQRRHYQFEGSLNGWTNDHHTERYLFMHNL